MATGAFSRSGEKGYSRDRKEAAPRACRSPKERPSGLRRPAGDIPITSSLTALAPAKINLFLHILGRRADGYHELDSLIAFADAHDVVRVQSSKTLQLAVDGPFAGSIGNDEGNLVLRAARLLADHAGQTFGASITLTKNLPAASGIGGGSADAAATLHALGRLWALDIDDEAMSRLGLSLGADVPVCLFGQTARVEGIGDRITPAANLPEAGLVLVNPGVAVATGAVFSRRSGTYSRPTALAACFADVGALVDALKQCRNDLAPAAQHLAPEIGTVLSAIEAAPGCLMARLSGSGATCFGLFADIDAARSAADGIRRSHGSWWIHAGQFLSRTPPPRRCG